LDPRKRGRRETDISRASVSELTGIKVDENEEWNEILGGSIAEGDEESPLAKPVVRRRVVTRRPKALDSSSGAGNSSSDGVDNISSSNSNSNSNSSGSGDALDNSEEGVGEDNNNENKTDINSSNDNIDQDNDAGDDEN
jgi:hypothetical protein